MSVRQDRVIQGTGSLDAQMSVEIEERSLVPTVPITEEHGSWPYRGARVRDPSPAEAVVQAEEPETVRHVGQHHDHGAVFSQF